MCAVCCPLLVLLLTCMLDTPACMLCRMPRGMALPVFGLAPLLLPLLSLLCLREVATADAEGAEDNGGNN